MGTRWEKLYRKRAEEALRFGPYAAVRTIQDICENTDLTGSTRLEHIRFFLNEIDIIVAQKKEA